MRRKYTYTYRDKFAQMCACVVCVCVCMLCVFLCIVHVCTGCMCLFSFCSHASSLEKERGRTVRGSGKRLWGAVRVGFFILAKRRGGLISGLIILGVYDPFDQFTGSLSAICKHISTSSIQLLCFINVRNQFIVFKANIDYIEI